MIRTFFLGTILIFFRVSLMGQCITPTIQLSSTGSSICGTPAVTVSGNTFGGGAIFVIISDDGRGTVSPLFATSSPFTFTYIPHSEDAGKKITITIESNDPRGKRCKPAQATFSLMVNTIPSAPLVGMVSQPSCTNLTGSAELKGLPAGRWTLSRNPDGAETSGTGSSATISNLQTGKYSFRVRSSAGCISGVSNEVNIQSPPFVPTVRISDPEPVCEPLTVDLTAPAIVAGSSTGLTFTYWRNSSATQNYLYYKTASAGTYFIKGTATSGCSDIKPVKVTVTGKPVAEAGPDKTLDFQFSTMLEADNPGRDETGNWSVLSGSGSFSDAANPKTVVSDLELGSNVFLWTLSNQVCEPSSDSVNITVLDLVVPTLITPNMDSRNDYLKIPLNETLGKTVLNVFNRKGITVYSDPDYNNDWNGLDANGNLLPEGTYFYVMRFENRKSASGYVVIRR